jgi:flagellar hook assembly protein FlgD
MGVGPAFVSNDNFPLYKFNTSNFATQTNVNDVAKSALDLINVVPNPYYGFSTYETSQLDNRIKIVNLPDKCTISIYTVSGAMVRQFKKDDNTITSLDWDLKNHAGIPIAGGVYIIHVKADGIGEKVIKWFGALRPTDLNSF